jgi:hypothetical protein
VFADNPSMYWRLGEPSGVIAGDSSSSVVGGAAYGTVTRGVAGGLAGDTDKATTFDGSTGYIASGKRIPSPTSFSAEAWFNTTTTRGGKIFGFGSNQTGNSTQYDKHVYMTNSGQLTFGVYANGAGRTTTSPSTYRNGQWHQVVATQGSHGITLYVDGAKVAGNTQYTTNQNTTGFWRVGGDSISGWPSRPSSDFFSGTIDDFSVYPAELTAAKVLAHYTAGKNGGGGGGGSNPPGAPGTLSSTASTSTTVDLAWGAATNASSYRVERQLHTGGSWATVQSGITGQTFHDTGLSPETAYDYRVIATNSVGDGPPSNVLTVTTPSALAPLLANTFEGGTSGSAITAANSGGASGNAFDAVACGSGTVTYVASPAAHGGRAAQLAPSTAACYLSWTSASIVPSTSSYGRAYIYFTARPSTSDVLLKLMDGSGARDAQINMDTAGHLRIIDAANGKQAYFGTAVPLNQWVRIEWHLANSTSAGSMEVRMYAGDSLSPLEAEASTGIATGSSFAALQLGQAFASTAFGTTIGVDDVAYGTTGWLGPP